MSIKNLRWALRPLRAWFLSQVEGQGPGIKF
jgi:hypothetical protein